MGHKFTDAEIEDRREWLKTATQDELLYEVLASYNDAWEMGQMETLDRFDAWRGSTETARKLDDDVLDEIYAALVGPDTHL